MTEKMGNIILFKERCREIIIRHHLFCLGYSQPDS